MSKEQKLVSFLIAAYNEENFVIECIDSCLLQTYGNIEIIVVDDGSSDRTSDLVKAYAKNNNKVRFFSYSKNKGKVYAYNLAFEKSKGDYICLIGADDINFDNRIEVCMEAVRTEKVDLVVGSLEVCDRNLSYLSSITIKKSWNIFDLLFSNRIPGGATFFTRSHALLIFPIPCELRFEDWWISLIVTTRGSWSALNVPVIKYRQHDANDIGVSGSAGERRKKDWKRHDSYYIQFDKYFGNLGHPFSHPIRIHTRGCRAIKLMYLSGSLIERYKIASAFNFPIFVKYRIVYFVTLLFGSRGYDFLIEMKNK